MKTRKYKSVEDRKKVWKRANAAVWSLGFVVIVCMAYNKWQDGHISETVFNILTAATLFINIAIGGVIGGLISGYFDDLKKEGDE